MVAFKPLDLDALKQIITIQLRGIAKRVSSHGIILKFSSKAQAFFEKKRGMTKKLAPVRLNVRWKSTSKNRWTFRF
jgi:ATP-dependent Clp protease ATP-binding subunit ClpA